LLLILPAAKPTEKKGFLVGIRIEGDFKVTTKMANTTKYPLNSAKGLIICDTSIFTAIQSPCDLSGNPDTGCRPLMESDCGWVGKPPSDTPGIPKAGATKEGPPMPLNGIDGKGMGLAFSKSMACPPPT
jgi:hypothetical protein